MRYLAKAFLASIVILISFGSIAEAQMGGGMPGGGPSGGMQPSGEEKKEGVAEAAPKSPGLLPTTPTLPPPKGRRKRWKLFELEGYFRMRTDWDKNFNQGFLDDDSIGGAPWPRALSCNATALNHPCDDSLSSANMRLRLEPTFNIDEDTSVHVQADVFDNLVLGSTPIGQDLSGVYTDTNRPPIGAFGNTQGNVVRGINSVSDAITVKRAWAEVGVPLGILKAGRMPNHWGMGMWANGGGKDPISGEYNYNGDYGDTVDRVSFSAQIPGTALHAMIASDWDSTRLISSQTDVNKGHEGHAFDLDDNDDSNAWVGVISKLDTPQDWRDAVDRGETIANYGVYFEYKTQDWDYDLTGFTLGGAFDPAKFVPRGLKTYTPDLWGKLAIGPSTLEGEVLGQFGTLATLTDQGVTGTSSIRKFGGVGRYTWKGVEGKLRMGIESGFATGDQWDNTVQGQTNVAYANLLGDSAVCNARHTCNLTQFIFNRDYQVDLILWHQLYGAVTNAVYAKPFLQYDITKSIMFKVSNVTSFALKPVSTPGNGSVYGTEFDGDIGYNAGHIFAGLSYGVLFPFSALAHPPDDVLKGGGGFNYGTAPDGVSVNQGDAATSHTVQARLVLTF
ncbi:MAG TPA: TIGR04551 family protein [Kofleriaceae bacterium]